jgi:hypothetical protein
MHGVEGIVPDHREAGTTSALVSSQGPSVQRLGYAERILPASPYVARKVPVVPVIFSARIARLIVAPTVSGFSVPGEASR